jgi:hypothetical protein
MAATADSLEVAGVPPGSSLGERHDVVDLLGQPHVADFADRVASQNRLAGRLPPLSVIERDPLSALGVGPAST